MVYYVYFQTLENIIEVINEIFQISYTVYLFLIYPHSGILMNVLYSNDIRNIKGTFIHI